MSQGESTVSQATISQRAEALEKTEKEAAEKGAAEEKAKADKEAAEKAAADKAAADKAEADKKAAEDKAGQEKDPATGKFKSKEPKVPNDPDEMRKWNTRVSQENKKLREQMTALQESQDKLFKMLSGISKQPIDYKELAKDPEKLQRVIEEERENATAELKEQLDAAAADAKAKDTYIERMRRAQDKENYPEWERLFPHIQKLAMGPTGAGDPRIDYTKPAGEVLDSLYELALQENPKAPEPAKPAVDPAAPVAKTYTEEEFKAAVADAIAKEKDAIGKTAKELAEKEAQEQLARETAGGTVAGKGKGAGRIPSDQLAAFKKMDINQQRDWLIANSPNQQ